MKNITAPRAGASHSDIGALLCAKSVYVCHCAKRERGVRASIVAHGGAPVLAFS